MYRLRSRVGIKENECAESWLNGLGSIKRVASIADSCHLIQKGDTHAACEWQIGVVPYIEKVAILPSNLLHYGVGNSNLRELFGYFSSLRMLLFLFDVCQ